MQIIEDLNKMQETAIGLRSSGKLIALVSTSGALHAGHAALMRRAREEADIVIVSTVVNPLEFGPNEDYQRYPRNSSGDAEFCEKEGVDFIFRPSVKELFPGDFSLSVSETSISGTLCGVSRPNYFSGVCTLHAMLFNLVRPDHVVLGMRDPQKVSVIRKLVDELHFPMTIFVEDIVRDMDGLPFNSRNTYLNDFQRRDAATLHTALCEGKKLVDQGISNVDRVLAEVTHHISKVRRLRVIYVAAVSPVTMEPVRNEIVPGKTLVVTAAWCDEVRLIDNILL